MSLTNTYAQKLLSETETKLQAHYVSLEGIDALRCELVLKHITLIKILSASKNEIPGLRGLGLENAITFCEAYTDSKNNNIRSFKLSAMFKSLGQVL